MKTTTAILILIFSVSLLGAQTTADAVRIRLNEMGFGARYLAMGANGVAAANDYSAIYWNPAGLAQVKKTQIFGDLSHLKFTNQALFSNNLTESTGSYTRFRSFGLALPFPTTRGSFVLAFGYNFVRDFDDYTYFTGFNTNSNGLAFELEDADGNLDWYDFDRNVTQTEEVTDEGGLHQWSVGGAVALSPNFDVGVTVNFWSGKSDYRLRFLQEDLDELYNTFPADFYSYGLNQKLTTHYRATSFKLGGIFKLNRYSRIGLAVEMPTTFRVREEYSSNDELTFDDGYVDAYDYGAGEWEYKVKTPFRFDAGVVLGSPFFALTAGATYQDWTQTRFELPDNTPMDQDYSDLLNENMYFSQEYRETVNYHLGGEVLVPGMNLYLRGGYAVYPSPLKDAVEEMNRVYYTAGIGFRINPFSRLDLTYLRGKWQRQTEDQYTPGGTLEDITEDRILLGFSFSF